MHFQLKKQKKVVHAIKFQTYKADELVKVFLNWDLKKEKTKIKSTFKKV